MRELNKGLLVRENRKRQKERQRKLVKPGPNDGKRGHRNEEKYRNMFKSLWLLVIFKRHSFGVKLGP